MGATAQDERAMPPEWAGVEPVHHTLSKADGGGRLRLVRGRRVVEMVELVEIVEMAAGRGWWPS